VTVRSVSRFRINVSVGLDDTEHFTVQSPFDGKVLVESLRYTDDTVWAEGRRYNNDGEPGLRRAVNVLLDLEQLPPEIQAHIKSEVAAVIAEAVAEQGGE
jgi:hypothetical protein